MFDQNYDSDSRGFKRCKSHEPGMVAIPLRYLLLTLPCSALLQTHNLRCPSLPSDSNVLMMSFLPSAFGVIDDAPETLSYYRKMLRFEWELMQHFGSGFVEDGAISILLAQDDRGFV